MTETLRQAEWEAKQANEHDMALEVCELYADMTPLDKACSIKGLSPASFFRIKRNNPDVQKAFYEAKEVQAELRLSEIDNLESAVLTGELDKDIFSTVVKSKQWSISKLRPDLFGTRTTIDVSGTIEHSPAKALAKMSEEQLLQLAQLTPLPAPDASTPAVLTPAEPEEAEFEEITVTEENSLDNTPTETYTTPKSGDSGISDNSKSLPDSLGLQQFGGWR
jgi:hypothetical protein